MAWNRPHRPSRPLTAVLAVVALVGLLLGSGSAAQAGTSVQDAKGQLDSLVAQIRQAAAARDALRAQMAGLLRRIDENRRALEQTQTQVDATRSQIEDLRSQVDAKQAALDQRAADAYVMGPSRGLEVALGATSMSDFQVVLEYLNDSSRSDQQLIDDLTTQKTELRSRQADLAVLLSQQQGTRNDLSAQATDLGSRLSRQTAAVAALQAEQATAEALVQTLEDQAARAAARREVSQAGRDPGPKPNPKPKPDPNPPPPPDPGPEAVKALITQYFTPLGEDNVTKAMCVADRESSFNPLAENPISGAAGVFQFLPSTWDLFAPAAGWDGHSAFEAEANVAVAAWVVGNYGWSSWASDSGSCGL